LRALEFRAQEDDISFNAAMDAIKVNVWEPSNWIKAILIL